jgi:site-specific DNA recombinase
VGGNRPFGWQADRRKLDPVEAALVRQAAVDILAGVGLHTICRQWNAAGIITTPGNPWRRGVLKNVLLSPRLPGFRVYQGKMARNSRGEPILGQYEPILDVETWESVCAVLTAPERTQHRHHVGGRKYLLTGVARCGACGQTITGNADTRYGGFHYSCRPSTSAKGGCGKVSVSGPALDRLITGLVLAYLSDRQVERIAELAWPHEADLSTKACQIKELMDAYKAQRLSGDLAFGMVAELEAEVAELRKDRSRWTKEQSLAANLPTNAAEAWPDLALEQQRAVIESVMQAVVVARAVHRSNRFDPERVEAVWR